MKMPAAMRRRYLLPQDVREKKAWWDSYIRVLRGSKEIARIVPTGGADQWGLRVLRPSGKVQYLRGKQASPKSAYYEARALGERLTRLYSGYRLSRVEPDNPLYRPPLAPAPHTVKTAAAWWRQEQGAGRAQRPVSRYVTGAPGRAAYAWKRGRRGALYRLSRKGTRVYVSRKATLPSRRSLT